jgi:hypothetical protein
MIATLLAALPGSSGGNLLAIVLAIGGILLSSGLGAIVAFTVARRNAKVAANVYVTENQRIVAEARAKLIDQMNDELIKIYMFQMKIRKILLLLSSAAGSGNQEYIRKMEYGIADLLGELDRPPRIVNGRASDYE